MASSPALAIAPGIIVIVCWQLAVSPLASEAVQVTRVVPVGYIAGALLVMVGMLQLSVAVAFPKTMVSEEQKVRSQGQVIIGGVLSLTVKFAVQVAKLPPASVTEIVTMVTPVETRVPAAGDWVIVSAGAAVQLSDATTPEVKSGIAAWQFASAEAV